MCNGRGGRLAKNWQRSSRAPQFNKASAYSASFHSAENNKCEFQKSIRLEGVKKAFFHRRGCDCAQKRMQLVSIYTKEDATSFKQDTTTNHDSNLLGLKEFRDNPRQSQRTQSHSLL